MFTARERLLAGFVASVAAAGAFVVIALPSRAATTVTFRAYDRQSVDVPGALHKRGSDEPARGDSHTIDEVLKNSRNQAVGYSSGSCVLTNTGGLLDCLVTAAIPGGTISVAGIISFKYNDFTLAIIGGTGKYAGARGSMTGQNQSDDSVVLTFTLL